MPNDNEYLVNDKRYLKEIKRINIEEVFREDLDGITKNTYQAKCKIHQRGEKYYCFDTDAITLIRDNKIRFWLPDALQVKVKDVITEFENSVENLRSNGYKITTSDNLASCWFFEKDGEFDALFELYKLGEINMDRVYKKISYKNLITEFDIFYSHASREYLNDNKSIFDLRTREELINNPFFQYAIDTNNERLQYSMLIEHNYITKEECLNYSEIIEHKVLPPFPEGLDSVYCIKKDEIDWKLMICSGYGIWHTPHFAMQGKTHSIYTINPYSRKIVDSAKRDNPTISFNDFLKLFNCDSICNDVKEV